MDFSNIIATQPTKVIYRDGNTVIKMMNEQYPASHVLNEALNQAIVCETGLKVPKLYDVVKVDGKWCIIDEYIKGKTFNEILKENPTDMEKNFKRFVEIQLEMHSHSVLRLRHLTDKTHGEINASDIDPTIKSELHTRLNGLHKHNKLCHGDFIPSNIIITPSDEAYVIDWPHATQGNASADAARTYLRFKLDGNDEYAKTYLKIFCEKSNTAKRYVQKWMSIVAASQLSKKKPEEHDFLMHWVNVVEYA
jgi:tRNA A-37 threonylcarbamoyl transferase component Bud32